MKFIDWADIYNENELLEVEKGAKKVEIVLHYWTVKSIFIKADSNPLKN